MQHDHGPADAELERNRRGRTSSAMALREREATPRRITAVTRRRSAIALIAAALVAGCGSKPRSDTHAKASNVVAQCCEHLRGGDRDKCLAEMPRVDDQGAARTSTNQQTYACVVDHFVCDPQTGRATQPSAQAQYDCVEDLSK